MRGRLQGLPKLTFVETKLFLREPAAVFFALAVPLLLLVILGSIPGFRQPISDLGGLRVIDLYLPIIVAIALTTLGLSTLPTALATYRERGILRRLATTPGPTPAGAPQPHRVRGGLPAGRRVTVRHRPGRGSGRPARPPRSARGCSTR
jgi:hypothetical protein